MKRLSPKFLMITDNTSYQIGGPRYLGPYRICHELENYGIQTFVIDKFYSFPDFFKFINQFLDDSFVGVGFSTTFLSPPEYLSSISRYTSREKRSSGYYNAGIISSDSSERKEWFKKFKTIIKNRSPKAKVFVGGSKAQFFYHSMYNDIDEIDYVVMGVVDKVFPSVLTDIAKGKEPIFKWMGNKKVIDTADHYKQPKICPPHKCMDQWFTQKNEVLPVEIGRTSSERTRSMKIERVAGNCQWMTTTYKNAPESFVLSILEQIATGFYRGDTFNFLFSALHLVLILNSLCSLFNFRYLRLATQDIQR